MVGYSGPRPPHPILTAHPLPTYNKPITTRRYFPFFPFPPLPPLPPLPSPLLLFNCADGVCGGDVGSTITSRGRRRGGGGNRSGATKFPLFVPPR